MAAGEAMVDVHQHLWPAELVEALRSRATPPMLRGWTLHTAGEPPYEVDPADHDPERRAAIDPGARLLLSLSTPLGIEAMTADEAGPLLDAWHGGAARLGTPFGAWAAVTEVDPDLDGLSALLSRGFVGLQVSATALASPALLESLAPTLRVCEAADVPVLVHPGPSGSVSDRPGWWAAVVDYSAQLQAAWWSWRAVGRALLPELRVCFAAGAGLAPLLAERAAARGEGTIVNDGNIFVDTSSHGPVALGALVAALGADALVLGSDRPYARPTIDALPGAQRHAAGVSNPARLLGR